MLLRDKVALVTGAARGIGASIARRYAEEGASVVLGDRDAEGGRALAAELAGGGYRAAFCPLDVTSASSVDEAVAFCRESFGGIDILACNAGILYSGLLIDTPDEAWHRVIAVNLTGVFYCCRAVARSMVSRGSGGRIVITSSVAGKRAERFLAAYSASKFGVIGLMESMAEDLGPHNITVNCVCPGTVDTAMQDQLIRDHAALRGESQEEYRRGLLSIIPMGRMVTTLDVADVFVFLASPLARFVSGTTVNVDGGELRI